MRIIACGATAIAVGASFLVKFLLKKKTSVGKDDETEENGEPEE